ncbi:MAG: HAMP domain-containing protein, partial [Gemmatimonadetes bacterium]|nr:HAMP domain-containing protein [Gemmatimonadota bacterium]
MAAWAKAMFSSLGARLLVPVFITVGVVLAVHAYISFKSTEDHFLTFVGGEAERSSELIRRATHDGMLLNRLDEVQATIERIAEGPEVAAIRVYDKEGGIVLSSDSTEIGAHIPVDAAPCTRCHVADAPQGEIGTEAADVLHGAGGEVLRRLTVIPNEPGCSRTGCHTDASPGDVLGVLDVEMSMLPVQGALTGAKRLLVWTTAVLILLTGLVTAFVFRHLVQQPIARLQEGARQLAGGDLQTRVHVRGGHELARLGEDFNRMAEDLGRAQTALSEWSQTLETRVAEKASELRS